jgi:hypothetical protein
MLKAADATLYVGSVGRVGRSDRSNKSGGARAS